MNPLKSFVTNGNSNQPMFSPANPKEMLMSALYQKNPQAYSQLVTLMQNEKNPQQLAMTMMNNLSPAQQNQVTQMARQFGVIK